MKNKDVLFFQGVYFTPEMLEQLRQLQANGNQQIDDVIACIGAIGSFASFTQHSKNINAAIRDEKMDVSDDKTMGILNSHVNKLSNNSLTSASDLHTIGSIFNSFKKL